MRAPSLPRTAVTVSVRDVREGAYRALRAAGVPAGVADDAAADTAALELEYGCGLRILTALLETGDRVDTPIPNPSSDEILQLPSSGHLMLIAGPLVDIVSAEPERQFRITGIADPIVMVPALVRADTSTDLCIVVEGRCHLHRNVDPTDARTVWADTAPIPANSMAVLRAIPHANDHPRPGEPITNSDREAKWCHANAEGVTVVEEVWVPFWRHVRRYLV